MSCEPKICTKLLLEFFVQNSKNWTYFRGIYMEFSHDEQVFQGFNHYKEDESLNPSM